ncbi:hypothetical protein PGO51_02475 [Klebsiella aerogenes]
MSEQSPLRRVFYCHYKSRLRVAFLMVVAQEHTMPICTLSVEVKSRWWLPLYLKMLTLFCAMLRCEPDYQKVGYLTVSMALARI